MTLPKQTVGWSDRRICWVAVLIVVVFIVDGSLVPFDLTWGGDFGPYVWLQKVHYTPWSLVTATDIIVNALVGAPLGFFLMGALRSGGRRTPAIALLAVGALSSTVATSVEMLQVLSTLRQSSWNDVCAQTLGAMLGAFGWLVCGARFLRSLRGLAEEREPRRFLTRILQIYFPIYLLLQLTPVEGIRAAALLPTRAQTASVLLPAPDAFDDRLLAVREFAGALLLNIPIGMLAVLGWTGAVERRPSWRALPLGLGILLTVDFATGPARWSLQYTRELVGGISGIVLGLAAAAGGWSYLDPTAPWSGRLRRLVRISVLVWLLVMIGQAWQPSNYEVTPEFASGEVSTLSVVPLDSYRVYSASPVQALHDALLEFVVAFPLGFLLSSTSTVFPDVRARRTQLMVLVGMALLILIGVELSGWLLPTRAANTIDMLVRAAGAMAGLAAGTQLLRCRTSARGTFNPSSDAGD